MATINFSGLASGIDTEGLITATLDAQRRTLIKPAEDRVQEFTETNDSLSELKSKFETLQGKMREISSLRLGAVNYGATSSDETIVTATATNAASVGSYRISNVSLAKNGTWTLNSSGATYTSSSDVIWSGAAGQNVTVTIGTGSEQLIVAVPVTSSTTLEGFVQAFNESSGVSTRAVASVVNVGGSASPNYKVVINTLKTGTVDGSLSVSVDAAITAASRLNTNSSSAATNAAFTIEGIGTIASATNQVTDVIPNLTLNLQAATSSTTVTVSVQPDASATAAKLQDIVDAFNDIVEYINTNNVVTREDSGSNSSNTFSPLAKTRVDDNVLRNVRDTLIGAVYSGGTEIKVLADLGIETDGIARNGKLRFKADILTESLAKESSSVNQILLNWGDANVLTGTGRIDLAVRFNGTFDTTINANKSQITNLNDTIARQEAALAKKEQSLRAQFARFESAMSKLQQQQSQLGSALSALPK